jgi:2-oxo-3-hexenedioate decarboxylase
MSTFAPEHAMAEEPELDAIAAEAILVLGTGRQVTPFSERYAGLDLPKAYRIAAAIRAQREARGERPVGRKIGFTNSGIWAQYNVHQPIWGHIYDRTVFTLDPGGKATRFSLLGMPEPRIEPEIVFGLAKPPEPGMDEASLLECVDWIAHGFEIVQCIFPRWKFVAADTVAAYGLHGALLVGQRYAVASRAGEWKAALSSFDISLLRGGEVVDRGHATNVLGGPLLALGRLADVLAKDTVSLPLAAGEIVTTGTLTRAFPVMPGEVWHTQFTGITLPPADIQFVE